MAIFSVRLELVHVSEDRTRDFGPFPFIQITYETIRVGEEGETEVAWFVDGEWETVDGMKWTDATIWLGGSTWRMGVVRSVSQHRTSLVACQTAKRPVRSKRQKRRTTTQ